MGNSKVIFGNETLIDLTGDTVTSDTLLAGTTAHNRSGEQIVGTVTVPEELDDLTDVTITSAADGDLLQYNSTSGKWENSDEIPQELAAMQEAGAVNLIKIDGTSQVVRGVTFTADASAGSVTINGTNDGSAQSTLTASNPMDFSHYVGKTMTLDLNAAFPSGSGYGQLDFLDANLVRLGQLYFYTKKVSGVIPTGTAKIRLVIFVNKNQTINNLVLKPMLYDARLVNPPYQPFTMTNRELTDGVTKATYFNETYTSTSPAGTLNVKGHYFVVGKMCLLFLSYTASVDLSGVTAMSIPNVQLPAPINPNNQSNDIVISVPRDWSGNISMMAIRHSPAGKIQFYYIPKGANTITVVYETV